MKPIVGGCSLAVDLRPLGPVDSSAGNTRKSSGPAYRQADCCVQSGHAAGGAMPRRAVSVNLDIVGESRTYTHLHNFLAELDGLGFAFQF